MHRLAAFHFISLATLLAASAFAAPLELTIASIQTTDSGAVRVVTGHKHQWPGVTIVAPDGHWDLSRFGFVEGALKKSGAQALRVACRVDNDGAGRQGSLRERSSRSRTRRRGHAARGAPARERRYAERGRNLTSHSGVSTLAGS